MANNNKHKYPESLSLYPFQREDVDRMMEMPNILLFSEMGTGKTIETIVHVQENNLYPALVICPTTLKLNWWDEIKKWDNEEAYYCETVDELVEGYFENLGNQKLPKWFVIHHEALAYVYEDDPVRQMVKKIRWKTCIVDESHRFRNPHTFRTSTLMDMNKKDTKYMFLSGTPIVNSTFDLYPLLKIIGLATDENRFLEQFTYGRQTQWGYQVISSRHKEDLLNELAPIYIRRTKVEVLKDLPPKTYQQIKLEMPPDQRQTYDHYETMMVMLLDEGETLTSPNVLSLMTRLRQLSLDPTILGKKSDSSKTRAIEDLLDQAPKDKWVVGSTSKVYVKYLASLLKGSVTLTGDDKKGYERYQKEQSFKYNPAKRVLLTTMFTGGLGLNLQVANHVIITDPWFNKVTVDQQIDRLHRIGQTKPVSVYELINEKSIDEDILEKVRRKEQMADEIVVDQDVIRSIYERHTGHSYTPKAKEEVPEL